VTEPSQQPLADFLSSLASEAPTPGGGTAAAVAGAMGAALTEMVVALTLAREKYASAHAAVRPIGEAARAARAQFLVLAHEDAECFLFVSRSVFSTLSFISVVNSALSAIVLASRVF
jgi:formiminotetrahydrofolate cyclodeaminase